MISFRRALYVIATLVLAVGFSTQPGWTAAAPQSAKAKRSRAAKTADDSQRADKLDINTATKDELDALPGVGAANAQKIIDGRPYRAKSDLVRKNVISSSTYNKIKDQITAHRVSADKNEGGSAAAAGRASAGSKESDKASSSSPVSSDQEATASPATKKSKRSRSSEAANQTEAASDQSSRSSGTTGGSGQTEAAQSQTPPQKGMVWVNLPTGVYHREGDRWYGKTKNGKFMSEADAVKAGYRPAKNSPKE